MTAPAPRRTTPHRVATAVAVVLPGGPIFGPRGAAGRFVTDVQLDECHGTTSTVTLNGTRVRTYRFVATLE